MLAPSFRALFCLCSSGALAPSTRFSVPAPVQRSSKFELLWGLEGAWQKGSHLCRRSSCGSCCALFPALPVTRESIDACTPCVPNPFLIRNGKSTSFSHCSSQCFNRCRLNPVHAALATLPLQLVPVRAIPAPGRCELFSATYAHAPSTISRISESSSPFVSPTFQLSPHHPFCLNQAFFPYFVTRPPMSPAVATTVVPAVIKRLLPLSLS